MDGCFVLKRHKTHAGSINDPMLKGTLFFKTPEQLTVSSSPSAVCRDFRSGNIIQKQHSYCDFSGIFGAVCNHGLVFGLMNILKGESLAYSIEMINRIRDFIPMSSRLVVAYDIFCKIKDRLDLNADDGFVPEMHSYNHNDSCRSLTCPKRMLGFGWEDGEDCERFWSYLRSVAYLTSVMRVENREDVLTLVCLAYNQYLTFNLVEKIKSDLSRCQTLLSLYNSSASYEETKLSLEMANNSLREKGTFSPSDDLTELIREAGPLLKDLEDLKNASRKQGKLQHEMAHHY